MSYGIIGDNINLVDKALSLSANTVPVDGLTPLGNSSTGTSTGTAMTKLIIENISLKMFQRIPSLVVAYVSSNNTQEQL